jgi:hypothetical protein
MQQHSFFWGEGDCRESYYQWTDVLNKLKDFVDAGTAPSLLNTMIVSFYKTPGMLHWNFCFHFAFIPDHLPHCRQLGQLIALLPHCLNWKIHFSLQLFCITLGTVSSLRVSVFTLSYYGICHTRISGDLFRLDCANITASWTVGNALNELIVCENRPHFWSFSYTGPGKKIWTLNYLWVDKRVCYKVERI